MSNELMLVLHNCNHIIYITQQIVLCIRHVLAFLTFFLHLDQFTQESEVCLLELHTFIKQDVILLNFAFFCRECHTPFHLCLCKLCWREWSSHMIRVAHNHNQAADARSQCASLNESKFEGRDTKASTFKIYELECAMVSQRAKSIHK